MSELITNIKNVNDLSIRKVFQEIVDLSVPRGKQGILQARAALNMPGWHKWIEQREKKLYSAAKFKAQNSIAGNVVDLSEFNEHEFIIECYEEYLRMAQLEGRGRSKVTFVNEDGKMLGKKVIDMEFEEYMKDCLKNLNWKKTVYYPRLLKAEQDGFIGIQQGEYDKTMAVCHMCIEAIKKFLAMPEKKRFLYV